MTDERKRLLKAAQQWCYHHGAIHPKAAERLIRLIEANCERVREECAKTAERPRRSAHAVAADLRAKPINIMIEEEQGCSKPPP